MGEALRVGLIMLAVTSPFLIGMFMVHYFKYRSQVTSQLYRDKERIDQENAGFRRELKDLRERVEVLETIVTDKRYDLSTKIANL